MQNKAFANGGLPPSSHAPAWILNLNPQHVKLGAWKEAHQITRGAEVNSRVFSGACRTRKKEQMPLLHFSLHPYPTCGASERPPKIPWGREQAASNFSGPAESVTGEVLAHFRRGAGRGRYGGNRRVSPVRMGSRVAKLAARGKAFPREKHNTERGSRGQNE